MLLLHARRSLPAHGLSFAARQIAGFSRSAHIRFNTVQSILSPLRAFRAPRVPWARGLQSAAEVAGSCSSAVASRSSRCLTLLLRASGPGSLLATSAWVLSWSRHTVSASAVQCQEAVAETISLDAKPAAQGKHQAGPGVLGTIVGLAAALTAWGILAAVVLASIATPFVLVAAVAMAQWRLAGALGLFFATPYLVTFPAVPIFRRGIRYGIKRWLGPTTMCRVVNYSTPANAEPEPEPGTAAERKGRREMICFHPHGPFLSPVGLQLLLDEIPEAKPLSSPFLYYCAPVARIFTQLMGFEIGSVARADMNKMMKAGEGPLILLPGGFFEATISCTGHERVYLKKRLGFVKYALRHGYDLVPAYSVGESDLMANPQGGWRWRFKLNGLEIPATLPWGFPLLPLLPRRGIPLVVAVGPPVKMPKIANPTKDELKEHHDRYVTALRELYERAARGTASEGRPLEIW